MTEINNNDRINNLNAAKALPSKKEDKTLAADKIGEAKKVEDLGNNPQEAIGRSQVAKADSIANDLKVQKNNPKLVENADQFFDYVLEQYKKEGKPDAYEQACLTTAQFVNEFAKK